MAKVAIIPVTAKNGTITYNAVSGNKQTNGKTVGQALDALDVELADGEGGTIVIIQNKKPDRFFSAEQQQRLRALMSRWRTARDNGQSLSEQEQTELETLIELEMRASEDRSAALVNEATE